MPVRERLAPSVSSVISCNAVHWLLWLPVVALLVAYTGVYLARCVALLTFPFDLDQGEGYDAWSGWLINIGQSIYNDNSVSPYYSSNYPPVYAYVISLPMIWLGPSIPAARAVSSLASLVAALLVYLAVRQEGGRALPALAAAGLLLASNYIYHAAPLARVNALMLALSLGALVWLARPTRAATWLGLAILLTALFTKPTALDAAAAGLLFLLLSRGRRLALTGALALGGAGASGLLALELLSGGHFWTNVVVGNANPFDLSQARAYLQNFVSLHVALLGLASLQLLREATSRQLSGFSLFFLTSLVTAAAAGKWGAGESYFFGLIASSAVLAGKLANAAVEDSRLWLRVLIPLTLLAQAVLFSHGPVQFWLGRGDQGFQAAALAWEPAVEDIQAAQAIAQRVRRETELVLSEEPGFLIAANKPVVGNATHLRNLWEAGLWSPDQLVEDVRTHRFGLIILSAQLYPPPVLQAIGSHYYLAESYRLREREYLIFLPGAE